MRPEIEQARLNAVTKIMPKIELKTPAEKPMTGISAEKAALELEPSIRELETPLFAVFAGVKFEGGTFSRPADPTAQGPRTLK